MSLRINVLGPPTVERHGASVFLPRGRKVWGLLTYLALAERPPSRQQLVDLLFTEADDPLGALRWNLSELRRLLADPDAVRGRDRVELRLPGGSVMDAKVLLAGPPARAVGLPGLGRELLEGLDFASSPAFDAWLLGMRRHVHATARAVLREAVQERLAVNDPRAAVGLATRLVAADPFDEEGHTLLIRSHAASGDRVAATRQLEASVALFRRELGVQAPALFVAASAVSPRPDRSASVGGPPAWRALLESGEAAVEAGAVDVGLVALHQAADGARGSGDRELEARTLLALGSALVHAAKGRDREGAEALHRAVAAAEAVGERSLAAAARRELGYVDLIRGEYPSTRAWLAGAEALAGGDTLELSRIYGVRGLCLADMGAYGAAEAELRRGVELAELAGHRRQQAWDMTSLGKVHLLCHRLSEAEDTLRTALELTVEERWTAFAPLPEALLAETRLLRGDQGSAAEGFEHALTLGAQVDDACWEAYGLRGLGLVRAARGDLVAAVSLLEEAKTRCNRQSDTDLWIRAYSLDALCAAAVALRHPEAPRWVVELEALAGRAGMREMTVHAYLHLRDLGDPTAALAARALAAEVDNPHLQEFLAEGSPPFLDVLLSRDRAPRLEPEAAQPRRTFR